MYKIIKLQGLFITVIGVFLSSTEAMKKSTHTDFLALYMNCQTNLENKNLAAFSDNIEAVIQYCQKNKLHKKEFIDTTVNGLALLHIAVKSGDINFVRILFNYGVNVNIKMGDIKVNGLSVTPLLLGVLGKYEDIVEYLLTKEIDNIQFIKIFEILINSNDEVMIKKFLALMPISQDLLKILYNYKTINANILPSIERFFVHMRYVFDQPSFIDDSNQEKFLGNTPLHTMVEIGNLEGIKKLVESNPEMPQMLNNAGYGPIHIVIKDFPSYKDFEDVMQKRYIDILLLLLAKKPGQVNYRTKHGYTPLHIACNLKKSIAAFILMDTGNADPNAIVNIIGNDVTPYSIAASNGFLFNCEVIQNEMLKRMYPDSFSQHMAWYNEFHESVNRTGIEFDWGQMLLGSCESYDRLAIKSRFNALKEQILIDKINCCRLEDDELVARKIIEKGQKAERKITNSLIGMISAEEVTRKFIMTTQFKNLFSMMSSFHSAIEQRMRDLICSDEGQYRKKLVGGHKQLLQHIQRCHCIMQEIILCEDVMHHEKEELFCTYSSAMREMWNKCKETMPALPEPIRTVDQETQASDDDDINPTYQPEQDSHLTISFGEIQNALERSAQQMQCPLLYVALLFKMPVRVINYLLVTNQSPFEEYLGYNMFHWALWMGDINYVNVFLIEPESRNLRNYAQRLINIRASVNYFHTPLNAAQYYELVYRQTDSLEINVSRLSIIDFLSQYANA